jgi:hypothetical protein
MSGAGVDDVDPNTSIGSYADPRELLAARHRTTSIRLPKLGTSGSGSITTAPATMMEEEEESSEEEFVWVAPGDEEMVAAVLDDMAPEQLRAELAGRYSLPTNGLRSNLMARLGSAYLDDEPFLAATRARLRMETEAAAAAAAEAARARRAAELAANLDAARRDAGTAGPAAVVELMRAYAED